MAIGDQNFISSQYPIPTEFKGRHFLLANIGAEPFRWEVVPSLFNIFSVEQFHFSRI